MKNVVPGEDDLPQAKAIRIGTAPGEVDRIIDALLHTGVAAEGQDVERTAVTGDERDPHESALGEKNDDKEATWDAAAHSLFRL